MMPRYGLDCDTGLKIGNITIFLLMTEGLYIEQERGKEGRGYQIEDAKRSFDLFL